MATYQIEFGKLGDTYPVPPLTVRTTDPNVLRRTVVAHARPYITPVLEAMGRPELADCLFQTSRDQTAGQFLYLDLAGGKGAQFLGARITVTPERIQQTRTKGWTKGSAVIVSRPSRFGNPFTIQSAIDAEWTDPRRTVVVNFAEWLRVGTAGGWFEPTYQLGAQTLDRRRILDELPQLRGRDLACYCPLPDPGEPDVCHAAVLLALANSDSDPDDVLRRVVREINRGGES